MSETESKDRESWAKALAQQVYIIQAAGMVLAVPFVAGFIINQLNREAVKGTLAEAHFRWQINTFLIGAGLIAVALALVFFGGRMGLVPSALLAFGVAVWLIYRVSRGWVCLNGGFDMYQKGNGG